ncbi:MAG: hypothetical protein LAN64_05855 [Acidobacteriia bacterium]|nr:hypothetical protein [Terriglobia bacterium]
MRTNAQQELGKLKGEGNKVFNRTLAPKIDSALSEIEGLNKERERRMGLVFGPPEFQAGGYTGNVPWMGGWGLPRGAAGVVHPREFVSTEQATARFRTQPASLICSIATAGRRSREWGGAMRRRGADKWDRVRGNCEHTTARHDLERESLARQPPAAS